MGLFSRLVPSTRSPITTFFINPIRSIIPLSSLPLLTEPRSRSLYILLLHFIGIHYCSSNSRKQRLVTTKASSMAAAKVDKGKGGKPRVHVFDSEEVLAVALADHIRHLSCQHVEERGAFTVALSGGSLIKSLRKLVEASFVSSVDWSKWHVFWVDERVVPKDHADSNYFLAYNDFLSKIPIPAGNVYAMNDALSAEAAADDYETCLKHLVKTNTLQESSSESDGTSFPKFDLVLLGMGPDGHIASLFPGHQLLEENKKWVGFVKDSPKPPPERITFTLPVLNSSANIALVVAGQAKAEAVRQALGEGDHNQVAARLPVKMLSPEEGTWSWFLDKEAASKL